jgi:hypothetical protein
LERRITMGGRASQMKEVSNRMGDLTLALSKIAELAIDVAEMKAKQEIRRAARKHGVYIGKPEERGE